jgi:hypothetical protein
MANVGGRRVLKQSVSSAGFDSRREVEQMRRLLVNMSGHNGIRIIHGTRGIQFFGTKTTSDCIPWKVNNSTTSAAGVAADGHVKVCLGNWTRNGRKLTLNSDVDDGNASGSATHQTLPAFSASTTNYVWAELQYNGSSPLKDPALMPDVVDIATDTALPDDLLNAGDTFDTRNQKVLLATVAVDSDGKVSSITRHWYGGDFDDICIVPDGEFQITPGLTALPDDPRYTLELNRQAASGHEGELQLWGVDAAGYTSTTTDDGVNAPTNYGLVVFDPKQIDATRNDLQYVPFDSDIDSRTLGGLASSDQRSLQIDITGSDNKAQIYGFDAVGSGGALGSNDDMMIRRDFGGAPSYVDYVPFPDFVSEVADELNTGSPGAITHTTLDFTGSGAIGTGTSGGNTDHDDVYWHEYTVGTYTDGKSYRTTGEVHADDFIIEDRIANAWNAEGFDVDVTDDVGITTANDIDLNAGSSFTLDTITSALLTIGTTFDLDATGAVNLSGAVDVTLKSTGGGSTLLVEAANDYKIDITGAHLIGAQTAQNDAAANAAGVYHGHVTSLDALANSGENVAAIWLYSA